MTDIPTQTHFPTTVPTEGFIRVAAVISLPEILRDFGHDPAPIIESAGLKLKYFDNPEWQIPFTSMGRLFTLCVKATNCDHFGLMVGSGVSANLLGLTGFIMQHAPDVRTALNDFIHYLDLHDQGAVVTLSNDYGTSFLEYSIYVEGVESAEQIIDGSMAVGCNILKCLCGSKWKPSEILFTHKRPADSAPHSKILNAPLRFDADRNAVAFSSDWLKAKPPLADPWLYDYLKQQAEQVHSQGGSGTTGKLQPLLRILLLKEKCTLAEAASQLGIHSRTLNRRLQAEDTTFRAEVAKAGYLMARQFLTESSSSINDIAASVGYASTSGFAHAFKRWSGMTPSEWRKHPTGPK